MNLLYLTYLLRLWQDEPAAPCEDADWRLSLQDTGSNQERSFGSLAELNEYLMKAMVVDPSEESPDDWPGRTARRKPLPTRPDELNAGRR